MSLRITDCVTQREQQAYRMKVPGVERDTAMLEKLQRPLVIGGITLASVLWLFEVVNQTIGELGLYALFASVIGGGVWWLQKKPDQPAIAHALPKYVDLAAVQKAVTDAEQIITRLQVETADDAGATAGIKPQIPIFQAQAAQILAEMERDSLRVMVMGGKGSGKSALIQQLHNQWLGQVAKAVTLYEVPSFSTLIPAAIASSKAPGFSAPGFSTIDVALKQGIAADLVLFLVTGDLTDSEFQIVQQLARRKRIVLVFNKQDLFLPDERQLLLSRMQSWVKETAGVEVVAIAAAPQPLKVRQHQADGSVREWQEEQAAQVLTLTNLLTEIIRKDSKQLVMASSLGNAIALKAEAVDALNDLRRTRALPIVEQFQWISAATAFASPLPTLDVIATAAINAQMILDLGAIYQQKFSLDQAQKSVTALGGLILKLGLVELSTRTVSSLLKTNAMTYVVGGCIQAASAAYLTRVVGLALIEYFHTQEPNLTLTEAKPLAVEQFSQILQRVFQQNQQGGFLPALINQVGDRLLPQPASNQAAPSAPAILKTSTPQATASPTPLPPLTQPESQVLGENGLGIPLSLPNRDTVTTPH
jgi:uncharacterized protein